jgi:hypothetical protein
MNNTNSKSAHYAIIVYLSHRHKTWSVVCAAEVSVVSVSPVKIHLELSQVTLL